MEAQGISKTTSERPYKEFTLLAAAILGVFSLEKCARAYFLGEVNELIARMEFRWGPAWQNIANYSTNAPEKALDEVKALEKAFYKRMRDYPDPSQVKRYASLAGGGAGRSCLGAFGLTAPQQICPPIRLDCTGTASPNALSMQRVLCDRIRRAITIAGKGAERIESPTSGSHKAFTSIFGEDPTKLWEVPGIPARKMAAGRVVASRLRMIAKELRERDTLYRCVSSSLCTQGKLPFGPSGGAEPPEAGHPTEKDVVDNVAVARLCRNEVWLCPGFWIMRPEWQAATLVHEMLHLCFGLTCAWFQHDSKERKRNSAYCYEAFALIASGISPEPITVQECQKTPM